MSEETINIKCPECSSPLTIKVLHGIEAKSIKCPICGHINKFVDFPIIKPYRDEVTTYHKGDDRDNTIINYDDDGECTMVEKPSVQSMGKIDVLGTNLQFQLREGCNVIGRQASASTADFQIPLPSDNRKISREHLVVNVSKVGKDFEYTVSLYKKQVNDTYVNGVLLQYGDNVVLNDRDIIQLPDRKLQFIIPDEEKTELLSHLL